MKTSLTLAFEARVVDKGVPFIVMDGVVNVPVKVGLLMGAFDDKKSVICCWV